MDFLLFFQGKMKEELKRKAQDVEENIPRRFAGTLGFSFWKILDACFERDSPHEKYYRFKLSQNGKGLGRNVHTKRV